MSTEAFRFPIGSFSCIAICDAGFRYPVPMFFTNLPKEAYGPWLRERGGDLDELDVPYTCLLVQTGRERVLVDTGTGTGGLSPVAGKLLDHLRAAGIEPDSIDTVILTHGHGDHIGGTLDRQGKPAFPNARYVMFREEWNYWSSGPSLAELPIEEEFKNLLRAFARQYLPPIEGQLDLLDDESEISPGISAIAAFGHTPGHMAVQISSEGERLLFVADALIHPLNLRYPETRAVVDHQPEVMVSTRIRLLDRAAQDRSLVLATHFPFPGLGRVVVEGNRWEWRPGLDSTTGSSMKQP